MVYLINNDKYKLYVHPALIRASFCSARWNFSVGNFQLKFVSETQTQLSVFEGEAANTESLHEVQGDLSRVIQEETEASSQKHANAHIQTEGIELVIKVSIPDWKVMAFSSGPTGQLIWEHQVNTCFVFNPPLLKCQKSCLRTITT